MRLYPQLIQEIDKISDRYWRERYRSHGGNVGGRMPCSGDEEIKPLRSTKETQEIRVDV
jgi:hypothetical protein